MEDENESSKNLNGKASESISGVRGWGGGWVDFPEMLSIFSASKINLNLSNASVEHDLLQIKGRDFEVPGCGGFLLTQHNPALEEYFIPGEEIATYQDIPDMVRKIRYYLEHEEEREAIRKRGYQRALKEHTFLGRLEEIFAAVSEKNRKSLSSEKISHT